ncbi:MAG: hypothetical protein K6G80_04405 [Treponema sp.]|nr:hypothetical protein [Treponema sp.]
MEKHPLIAHFHLPGLFEFYEFYRVFLPLYRTHREFFYDWGDLASIYGSPQDCLWGGGRTSDGVADAHDVLSLVNEFGLSPRLTFSNSLIRAEHLSDKKCNTLCALFKHAGAGIIVHSDALLEYLKDKFPEFYFVSSTTKVLTNFDDFEAELNRDDFKYVVPDFRLNKRFEKLNALSEAQKNKVEFLCNECCDFGCTQRKACYENVSLKNLGGNVADHKCFSQEGAGGYRFSRAMKNPGFISVHDIQEQYLPAGFSNFKIEGRGLGNAILLEFILHYMTKPEHQLEVREEMYLDSMLDLF